MAVKKSQLYSSLLESCNQLRGGMDASQYKDYVLVVLFLKYISDKAKVSKDSVLVVPEGCSFDDMVKLTGKPGIGERMNEILAKIAEENNLQGVIDNADFNDSEKLGSGKSLVDTVSGLIKAFMKPELDFSKNKASDDDLLGDAYEYLMKNFASESGKSKGQFYTPGEVSRVMAKVVGIHEDQRDSLTIYDPTCGSGSLLLRALSEAQHPDNVSLYGQELDINNVGMAKMNMIIHGYEFGDIRQGDTLNEPQFKTSPRELTTFDYVVANPHFSRKMWRRGKTKTNDLFGRWGNGIVEVTDDEDYNPTPSALGVPPESNGDYAFLLHIVRSLKSNGKGACILPHGVLFRGNAEEEIRRNLVQTGIIKGIIGFPPNLFYGTGIPACIIVLDKQGAAERKGIFMIDAKDEFTKDGNKNRLREKDIRHIVDTWELFEDVPHYARFVPMAEIEQNDYNLNIPRYIAPADKEIRQDLEAHLHGGLPAYDFEQLSEYWRALPSLRPEIIKPLREGYMQWNIALSALDETVECNADYQREQAATNAQTEAWTSLWMPTFRSLAKDGFLPKLLIERMGADMLQAFHEAKLVDMYDAYQQLMEYWESEMQDDFYLILESGWTLHLHGTYKVMKQGKRKGEQVESEMKSEADMVCDLLPVKYVIRKYFAKQQAERDKVQEELSGLMADKVALEDDNTEVFEPANFDKNKVNKSTVAKRVKLVAGEELEVLKTWQILFDRISKKKQELKNANLELVRLIVDKYVEINKQESLVKQLVIEKWTSELAARMKAELALIKGSLVAKLRGISDRYDQTLPQINQEVEEYEGKVKNHLAQMGFAL